MRQALESLGLRSNHLEETKDGYAHLGGQLREYFELRAKLLHQNVEPLLMNAKQAETLYKKLLRLYPTARNLPLNKQSLEKKKTAYFTCIINILIEANLAGMSCDYNPGQLTTITSDGIPFRTLARRIDGAFPSPVNPIAIWEIKEYYYTTTFGSRIADCVYESILDGMELQEVRDSSKGGIDVKHYLMIDAKEIWWNMGRSYLCRIIDMLHMGLVDEVLFGREVETELPKIVKQWIRLANSR